MPETLDSKLIAATVRLIGRPLFPDEKIGIAVSGGADSLALLSAAASCWPGQVEAATVDHRLRPEARAEAELVARWCEANGVPHQILAPHLPITGNIQSSAREARYALLAQWQAERGIAWLMTAHQADDQIETMLLRLSRGAGVGGLASVRARRGTLLRPLLGERRADLRNWCISHQVPFVDDPTNDDARFDRVRMRQALTGRDLVNITGLARSVEALADADAALAWMTQEIAAQSLKLSPDAATLARTDLPSEILRRLLLAMIEHVNPQADKPRGPSIDQALVQLLDAKVVALADCIVKGGDVWVMRRAPARKQR